MKFLTFLNMYSDIGNFTMLSQNQNNEGGNSSDTMWSETVNQTVIDDCKDYTESHHIMFQLANLVLVLSFLAPSNSQYHSLFMRSLVIVACLLTTLWSIFASCFIDVMFWHVSFMLVNISYLIYIAYTLYPSGFHADLDLLYQKLFKPYHVPRAAFRELTSFGELRTYQDGETYAEETASVCGQYLSIVVSGRFSVSCEEFELHPIHPHQFLDSPEFEACAPEVIDKQKHFQVTITATEDSCIFQWDAAALRTFLKTHIFLETIFSMLIGKDITAKLHAVQQKIFQRNSTQQPLLITHSSSLLEIRNQILSGNHVDAMAALQRYANACRNAEHHCDGRSSISSVSISSPGPSMKIPVITKETCV